MPSYLQQLIKEILPILQNYQVKKAGFFGSILRKDFQKKSDVDLLIEMKDEQALKKYFELKFELEKKLGRQVDLVEYDKLHPRIAKQIMAEQITIIS